MSHTPLNGHGPHRETADPGGGNGSTHGLDGTEGPHPAARIAAQARREPAVVDGAQSLGKAAASAVARARTAQHEWHLLPLSERVAAITRAAREMLRRRAEVISLAREEMGKVDVEGLFNEALGPLDTVKGWSRIVERAPRAGSASASSTR